MDFKFPFFLVKLAYNELDQDDSNEMTLYRAQVALNRCDFAEGLDILKEFDVESLPKYLKAGYYYTTCVLCRNIGRLRDAQASKLKLQLLISEYPEHKKDLIPLLNDLDSLFSDQNTESTALDPEYDYNPAALAYIRCTSIYHSYRAFIGIVPDPVWAIFESISKEYDMTGDDILALSAHTYLAFLSHLSKDRDRFLYHSRAVISIYKRTGYYLLPSAFVTVLGADLEQLLDDECPELKEKLDQRVAHLHEMAESSDSYNLMAFKLNKTELQMCLLVAADKTNAEIAGELMFSTSYVNGKLSEIYEKLNLKNRKELKQVVSESLAFRTVW